MTATCPAGHTSESDDYCDVCGMPIGTGSGVAPSAGPGAGNLTLPPPTDVPTQAPPGQLCPNCSTQNVADALFCEGCGYDFTTGTMPRSTSPAPLTPPDGMAGGPSAGAAAPAVGPGSGGRSDPPHSQSGSAPTSTAGGSAAGGSAAGGSAAKGPAPGGSTPGGSTAGHLPDSPAAGTAVAEHTGSSAPAAAEAGSGTGAADRATGLRWVAEVWIDPAWYEVQDSPESLPSAGLPTIVPLRRKSVLIGRRSRSRNINPDIDCELDTGTSRRQAQLTTDGSRWFVEDLESSNGTFVAGASDPLPEDPIAVGVKRELNPDDRIYIGAWTRLVIREATEDEVATLG